MKDKASHIPLSSVSEADISAQKQCGWLDRKPPHNSQISRRLLLASGLAAGVSACSGPATLIGVETTRPLSQEEIASRGHRIFIATTRRRSDVEGEFFSSERSSTLSFAAVDVVLPPIHTPGKMERPRRLPADPDKHMVITNPSEFADRQAFRAEINREAVKRPRGRRNAALWVHGYNTNLTLAVLRAAQFVEDTGYDGIMILYSWASQAKLTGYVYDINSALVARDFLESVPDAVQNSSLESLDIIAHSMGNFVTMEAIRGSTRNQGFNSSGKIRNIILASPDIDIDVFAAQLRSIPKEQRRFFVLTSDDDRALGISAKIARKPRVGQLDPTALASLGVNVIDLSQVSDTSTIHHNKFADSPEIVKLIGDRILAGDSFAGGSRLGLGESVFVGATGAIQIVDEAAG